MFFGAVPLALAGNAHTRCIDPLWTVSKVDE
jgi:hypothetical protein